MKLERISKKISNLIGLYVQEWEKENSRTSRGLVWVRHPNGDSLVINDASVNIIGDIDER